MGSCEPPWGRGRSRHAALHQARPPAPTLSPTARVRGLRAQRHVAAAQPSRAKGRDPGEGEARPALEPAGPGAAAALTSPCAPAAGPSGAISTPSRAPLLKQVIVAGKDQGEVDNDYFLVPVRARRGGGPAGTAGGIMCPGAHRGCHPPCPRPPPQVAVKDHEGPLQTRFPIGALREGAGRGRPAPPPPAHPPLPTPPAENRLTVAQTPAELRAALRRLSARQYAERLADFHLLIYLAGQARRVPGWATVYVW